MLLEVTALEWARLKYFQTLAEYENLTMAAEKLYISASALSKSIMQLERELDTPLFDRPPGKSLKLNKQGKILYDAVNQASVIFSNAEKRMHSNIMSLSIAATSPMLFHNLIRLFKKEYSNISLTHVYINTQQLENSEYLKQFHFILKSNDNFNPKSYDSVTLYNTQQFMLMLYPDHPLAHRSSVNIQELQDETFIAISSGSSSRSAFDDFFEIAGFEPNLSFECDHMMREKLILHKEGIGITTDYSAMDNTHSEIIFVPINFFNYQRSLLLCWDKSKPQTAIMHTFRKFAIEYYDNITFAKY